jgi:pleckstrin homology domain-containing family G member 4
MLKDRQQEASFILCIMMFHHFVFQEFFPGIIHAVYVLRPASFIQKALSEVSNKFFKEEFRFRVHVCSSIEELYEHFDRSQLTPDLGGELQYSHSEWIQQRIVSMI